MIFKKPKTKKAKIKASILAKMKVDDDLKVLLMDGNEKSFYTIRNWIKANAKQLTTADNLNIIAQHYNIPAGEILTTK